MLRCTYLAILFFQCLYGFGQNKTTLIENWLQAKESNHYYQYMDVFKLINSENLDQPIDQNVLQKYSLLELNQIKLKSTFRRAGTLLTMNLPTPTGKTITLRLAEAENFTSDFQVNTPKGASTVSVGKHYRGIVQNQANSIAAISIRLRGRYPENVPVVRCRARRDHYLRRLRCSSDPAFKPHARGTELCAGVGARCLWPHGLPGRRLRRPREWSKACR